MHSNIPDACRVRYRYLQVQVQVQVQVQNYSADTRMIMYKSIIINFSNQTLARVLLGFEPNLRHA